MAPRRASEQGLFHAAAAPGELDERQKLWLAHGERFTADYADENPGKRPPRWWEYSRPSPEPRLRVGGVGTALYEHLMRTEGYPRLDYKIGIPAKWISRSDKQRMPFKGCGCCQAVDPSDPPRFESQAAYLRRLKLLLPDEERRLGPADFEPEVVPGARE
jgi:hypothetical protein